MTDNRQDLDRREKIDRLLAMEDDLKQAVQLLKDVKGALHILRVVGNSFKWLAGLIIAASAAMASWKHFFS